MDERNNAQLRLIKGKCAGKDGQCVNTELIVNGLCFECAADQADQAIATAQSKFTELTGKFPELAKTNVNGYFYIKPIVEFVKDMGRIRNWVKDGKLDTLASEALRLTAEMSLWQAEELQRRVGRSNTDADIDIRVAGDYLQQRRYEDSAAAAQNAIIKLEPFEQMRAALAKRMADRSKAQNVTPQADETAPADGSESQAS